MWGGRSFVRWLVVTAAITAGGLSARDYLKQRLSPFGVAMLPADGSQAVDPRDAVLVKAVGWGTRLAELKIRDDNGNLLAETSDQTRFKWDGPLDFGSRYRVSATIERSWTGRTETRDLVFTTVDRPALQGPLERALDPDGAVSLRFDRPVGPVEVSSPVKLTVERGADSQSVRLVPGDYPQGQPFPVDLSWSTTTGVPLPPSHLVVNTPPALLAEIYPRDLTNVGLAMPIQITFSETLAERDVVGQRIAVRTKEGTVLSGRWSWIGKNRLQFTPQPAWPASTTVEVTAEPRALRSSQGGTLDQALATRFSTGTDRRIFVYLDAQRMSAVENGQVVKTFKVSTGKPKTPTVAGSFYIYARFPIKTMRSRAKPGEPGHYVVENVPYAQYFHADYAFHGAWWHNGFGHPASHGCVNLSTRTHNRRWPGAPEDAGWLYRWASLGVPVTVLRSSPSQQMAMQSQ